jgi:hypothetical protein
MNMNIYTIFNSDGILSDFCKGNLVNGESKGT